MGLAETLRGLTDAELAALFAARPDLAEPAPGSFAELAQRASAPYSLQAAVASLDRFSRQLIEALSMVPRGADIRALGDMEAGDTPLDVLAGGLDRLRVLGLTSCNGVGVWSVLAAAARMFASPGGLGRPVGRLLERHPLAALRTLAATLGLERVGPQAGMRDIRDAITRHHGDPTRVRTMLAAAPPHAEELLCAIDSDGGRVRIPELGAPREQIAPSLQWLLDRAAAVRVDWDVIEIPGEIGLALRGGRPFARFESSPPSVSTTNVSLGLFALSPLAVLDALTRLGHAWAAEPVRLRKSGGMAVRDVKAAAKLLDVNERSAAMLIEVAHEAELIDEDLARDLVTVTAGFDDWLTLDATDRWLAIVGAWRRCMVDLSTLGLEDDRGRAVMPLGHHPLVAEAVARRARVTKVLAGHVGSIVEPGSLLRVLDWEAPAIWQALHTAPEGLVLGVLEDMALLGLLRDDALTTAANAALLGEADAARVAAAELFPVVVNTFLIQPDLTALAPAELAPAISARLTRLTQTESRGAASLLRFTEASLRNAFDRGANADEILEFLTEHAGKGVPQSLVVLIRDVERRHGVLRVGGVHSYIRSDDPALLAQVVRSKKLLKLGLRLVAPTVAVTVAAPGLLLSAVRESGFAPMVEDGAGGVVVTAAEVERATRPRWRRPRFESRADTVWATAFGATGPQRGAQGTPNVVAVVRRLRSAHDA